MMDEIYSDSKATDIENNTRPISNGNRINSIFTRHKSFGFICLSFTLVTAIICIIVLAIHYDEGSSTTLQLSSQYSHINGYYNKIGSEHGTGEYRHTNGSETIAYSSTHGWTLYPKEKNDDVIPIIEFKGCANESDFYPEKCTNIKWIYYTREGTSIEDSTIELKRDSKQSQWIIVVGFVLGFSIAILLALAIIILIKKTQCTSFDTLISLLKVGGSKNLDFLVSIDDQSHVFPSKEIVLEAICKPALPRKHGIQFYYEWNFCSSGNNQFRKSDMRQDGNKLYLSFIEEGEYEFEVKVGYRKNNSDYRNDLDQTARGKISLVSEFKVTHGGEKLFGSIPSTGRAVWRDDNAKDVYDKIPHILKDTISYKMPSSIASLNSEVSLSINNEYKIFLAQHIIANSRSFEKKLLEEKGFLMIDENLVIRTDEGRKKDLEIWHVSVCEKFVIPKLNYRNTQYAIFVEPTPQTLSIARLANENTKNVLLPQKNTEIGESIDSSNKFVKFPLSFEETLFYSYDSKYSTTVYKSGFNIEAKDDILVYIAQRKNPKGYFDQELTTRSFELVKDIEQVEVSLYNLDEVWRRNLNKGDEVNIPRTRCSHDYPIIFIKRLK